MASFRAVMDKTTIKGTAVVIGVKDDICGISWKRNKSKCCVLLAITYPYNSKIFFS